MARYWYFFNGTPSEEQNPLKYTKVLTPSNCNAGQTLCAIYAESNLDTGRPYAAAIGEFSSIFDYIADARFNSGSPQPLAKPFVYMRTV